MSRTWPQVALSEVLVQYTDYIDALEPKPYPKLSVKLYGKGVVLDTPADGTSLKMKRHQIAKAGQVILSEIWGKKGAIGFVPSQGDGALCTSHFFLFNVRTNKIEPKYLQAIFTANYLQEQLDSEAKGTTGYAAVRPKHLLGARIPLPPLDEQRCIISKIEGLSAKIEEACIFRQQTLEELEAFTRHTTTDLFPPASLGESVGDFISFQTGYAFKSEWFTDTGIRLVRNANIGHGTLDWSDTARISEERRAEFSRFELQRGDILIALDRPIISTGVKVARIRDIDLPCLLLQRVARAQFKSNRVLPDYLYCWLRSPHFANAVDPGRSNGVPHISHKDIEKISFAAPPLPEQLRVVAHFDKLHAKVNGLKQLQGETAKELDALTPSILSKAFSGEL